MGKIITVENKERLSIQELFALSGYKSLGLQAKIKGEIFIEKVDIRTGKVVGTRHIYNTRTWTTFIFNMGLVNFSTLYLIIANDDGDWHVRKNVMRSTYENNGGNYFQANPTFSKDTVTRIMTYIGQFTAPPAGTTKTINAVGITNSNSSQSTGTYTQHSNYIIAATRIPGSGEVQDEYTVYNITYKLTFTN